LKVLVKVMTSFRSNYSGLCWQEWAGIGTKVVVFNGKCLCREFLKIAYRQEREGAELGYWRMELVLRVQELLAICEKTAYVLTSVPKYKDEKLWIGNELRAQQNRGYELNVFTIWNLHQTMYSQRVWNCYEV